LSRQIEHCVSGVEGRPASPSLGIDISSFMVDSVDTNSSSSDDNSTILLGSDFMIVDMLNNKLQFLKIKK